MKLSLVSLKDQLLLALVFFCLTFGQEYLFYALKGFSIQTFAFSKYLGVYFFFFACTFIKGNIFRVVMLSFVLWLNFFQMSHLSFFGTQILPAEIWLLFKEFGEIQGALKEGPLHVVVPMLFTIIPLSLGYWANKKFKPHYQFAAVNILIAIYLIYNPVRTYITGNSWGRQPSVRELSGFNVYLSTSYFLGRILPHKLNSKEVSAKNYSTDLKIVSSRSSEWDKIILILGESHSSHNMQLFGYERETTPYLAGLKGSKNFFSTVGLSGGVSTDVSVAFFINMGYGRAGNIKAAKGDHCLPKLAQSQKFSVHFWSTQSQQQLRYIIPYICTSSISDLKTLEDLDPDIADENAASDLRLLDNLKDRFASPDKDFILLHQRGAHAPWNLRYSEASAKWKATPEDDRKYHYDNSILEYDQFWKELDQYLSQQKQRTLVIYVSDHGQATGQNGKWGHGFLEGSSFEIPIIMKSYNKALPSELAKFPTFPTHYNVGLVLMKELGLVTNHDLSVLPKDYEIYGNDIDGFAGSIGINFKDEKSYDIVKY